MVTRRPNAGGAAAGGGVEYQARVSAWAAVHVLAEQDVEAPFGLRGSVAEIACETSAPVDDLILLADAGCKAFVQVKRTVSLAHGRGSALASALDQFVRQLLEGGIAAGDPEDPSDAARDRFVLAVGAAAPASVRVHLRAALERIRKHPGLEVPSDGLDERRRGALEVVVKHVQASWETAAGSKPNDHDIRKLLSRLHVETIEVGEGERDELAAKGILRASVLDTPDQAAVAWSVLVTESLRLIATRGHADRGTLLGVLHSAGVSVRAARSYRRDIQRLREHSSQVISRLARHSYIKLGQTDLRIQRPYLSCLKEAAEAGPLLVVGEPGAGKSGLLYSLSEALRTEEREVVVLAAEQPPFSSPGGLRHELRLDHDVVDVLGNWPGARPAFLLVDALDAARADRSAAALRTLIREVGERANRWNVVASIREYDARYSPALAEIFKGALPVGPVSALRGESLAEVRHVVVGQLSAEELEQIGERGDPTLARLLESASGAVGELLRNPFNLRLAAELLDGGTDPQAIRDVGSQLDLLDLYWRERVLRDGGEHEALSREVVLRRAVKAMVQERVLHVDRDLVVTEAAAAPAIRDLLSAQVIVEWEPGPEDAPQWSTLAFAHHVLFDYAVARLLLRRSASRMAGFLASDPAFVLLGRPSVVMHFHHLWGRSSGGQTRDAFWESALAVCSSGSIPEIGKLIGPAVAAEIGVTVTEFVPLLQALDEMDEAVRAPAENALVHVVHSLLADRDSQAEVAELCCDLARRLSDGFTTGTAYPASWILTDLAPRLDQLSRKRTAQLGTASRRLLAFAWTQEQRDPRLVAQAIRVVCRTFATDVRASAELLRRAIEPVHLAQHGSEELSVLADAVTSLTTHDPGLVRDIYRAGFGYSETSESPTAIRRGVLSLTSNRRQDYQSALYQLVQSFPAFLGAAPAEAVEAMNAAMEFHVTHERPLPEGDTVEFDLDGQRARLVADYSHIWDRGQGYPDQDAIQLLDCVQQRLEELADQKGGEGELGDLLATLVQTCRLAVVWRRLLGLGARYPDRIGLTLRAAAWSHSVLRCPDTTGKVGEMIAALFLDLPEADRERIERAVTSIPDVTSPDRRRSAEHARDRLLGCLPEDGLVTVEARTRLSELRAADAVPENDDGIRFEFSSRAFGEEEYLAEAGVPVEEDANRRLRELERPVKDFAQAHANTAPEPQDAADAVPHLQRLYTALQSSDADGVHEKQSDYAWGTMAAAYGSIAKMEDLRCDQGEGALARAVLLEASANQVPTVDSDADDRFVDPMWSSPAARVEAAAGLMTILQHSSCDDSSVLAAVERLIADPAPCVRFQIACRLMFRYAHDPEWTWRMIERMARDRSIGVMRGLVRTLSFLRYREPERVASITIGVMQAVADAPNRKELSKSCVRVLVGLFVWDRDGAASAVIDGIADDPVAHLEEASQLVSEFREILVAGTVDPPDPDSDAARRRSWSFLLRVTKGAAAEFRRAMIREGSTVRDTQDSPSEEQIRRLAHVLDSVGWNIYFASGAKDGDERPDEMVLRRFYSESGEVVDELADVGLPQLSHHLLEALEVLVSVNPRGVFFRIARVIQGGRKGGYEYDSLAETVIVRIVDCYLADHRNLFRRDEAARRHLIGILDAFVRAGSENARRLSYGLGEVFR